LEAIAAARSQRRLAASIELGVCLPSDELDVRFAEPGGVTRDVASFGWPVPFLEYSWAGTYADVYARGPSAPMPVRPSSRWFGLLHARTGLDASGRIATRFVNLLPLGALGLWLVGAFSLGRVISRVARRRGGRAASKRNWPWISVGVAAAVALVLSALPSPGARSATFTGNGGASVATHLTAAQFLALRDDRGGDAVIARIILDSMDQIGKGRCPKGHVLAVCWSPTRQYTIGGSEGGWPRGLVSGLEVRQTAVGLAHEARYSRTDFDWNRSWVRLNRMWSDGLGAAWSYRVSLAGLSAIAFGLWCVWGAVGLVYSLLIGRRRQRLERRGAERRCLGCGYDLRGLLAPGAAGPPAATLGPCQSPSSSTPPATG
jgi:hypothetical protein